MKKSILAVAVLSIFAGVSQAESTIDLYQVAGTLENQSNVLVGTDVLAAPETATTQLSQAADAARINLIQSNVTDNTTIVTQAGASTANVFVNVTEGSIVADPITGDNSDPTFLSAADAGVTTERNYINVSQAADGEVANIMLDGTDNTIITSQSLTGSVNVVAHAVNSSVVITQ